MFCTISSLYAIRIANELREFRNYLLSFFPPYQCFLNLSIRFYKLSILFLQYDNTLVSLFGHVTFLLFFYTAPFVSAFSSLPHHLETALLLHVLLFDYLLKPIHNQPCFFLCFLLLLFMFPSHQSSLLDLLC